MRPPPLPADLVAPSHDAASRAPYQALPPPMHTSTMPSEAPTATTVRPPAEVIVAAAPRRDRSRSALWALAAGATGFAIGLVAQIPLTRDEVAPASADRVGSTVLDVAATAERAIEGGDAVPAAAPVDDAADAADEERGLDGEADVRGAATDAARDATSGERPDAAGDAAPGPQAVATTPQAPPPAATAAESPAPPTREAPTSATPRVDASDPYAERPSSAPATTAAAGSSGFDRVAATSALGSATSAASSCRGGEDPTGVARVTITFAPSGRVTQATVNGAPYAGTATGSCIARAFRSASVPAFAGEPVTVTKTVTIR